MAPLSQALGREFLESNTKVGGCVKHTYHGVADLDWMGGSVLHGGYILCLLVTACIKHQEKTNHRDPIHVTAHYLLPAAKLEYAIEVEVTRTGSRFCNLTANFVQDGKTRVMTHMIFGTLPAFEAPPSNNKHENIPPSHPLYHPIPILSHPSEALIEIVRTNYFKFRKHLRRADDLAIIARNKSKLAAPLGTHDGGIDSGLWVELTGKDEELGLGMLPLFADVFQNPPASLAELEGEEKPAKWYPTMLITIEFKRQFPRRGMPGVSRRTLGVYSKCSFLEHGRHDIRCEIWSAPSNPGEPGERDADDGSWKQGMRCMALTGQVALTSLIDVNKGGKKAKL